MRAMLFVALIFTVACGVNSPNSPTPSPGGNTDKPNGQSSNSTAPQPTPAPTPTPGGEPHLLAVRLQWQRDSSPNSATLTVLNAPEGTYTNIHLNFGDGSSVDTTSQVSWHIYQPGTYIATVVVTTVYGQMETASITFTM